MSKALTIKLSAGDLQDWAKILQWFYPSTMRLSTYVDLRTDRITTAEAEAEVMAG